MAIIEAITTTFSLALLCSKISAQILPTSSKDQGSFARSEVSPTEFCYRFNPAEVSFGYCSSACLLHSGDTYLVALNQVVKQCACCDHLQSKPHTTLPNAENWVSFVRCPVGFTEARYKGHRYCFKLFWSPEPYPTAAYICENLLDMEPGVELVKLNSLEKLHAFETFLKHLNAPADVWIQGKKHLHKYKYHDGTLIDVFCPLHLTNGLDEYYMRFKTYEFKCADYNSTPLSFVCEATI